MIQEFTEEEVNSMSQQELVEEYLKRFAAEEPAFQEKLDNPNKSIQRCMEFIHREILEEYKEQRGAGFVGVWHNKVFDIAVHYYDEQDLDIDKPKPAAKPFVPPTRQSATGSAKVQQKPKEKPEQADLFSQKPAPVIEMKPRAKSAKPAAKPKPVEADLFADFF